MRALLSFGLPVYNGEAYVGAALDSLRAQTLADIEIVVSDNGSTDGTEEICRQAAREDDRVVYLRSPVNRGGTWNYRNVVHQSASPYFSWMAADDVKLPDFAKSCVAALDAAGEGCVLVYPRTQLIDADGTVFEDLNDRGLRLDDEDITVRLRSLYWQQAVHVLYGVIRRDALDRTRGYQPVVGDDVILLTELACQGMLVRVDEQLFWQRRHAAQASAQGKDLIRWSRPDARIRFAFPQTRMDLQLYRAVASSSLPLAQKVRCWRTVTTDWVLPRLHGVGRDVATALGIPEDSLKRRRESR